MVNQAIIQTVISTLEQKERPTKNDILIINNTVEELIIRQNISPVEDPFGYLWMVNCVLYATVVAFLLLKGWKKPTAQGETKKPRIDRKKKDFQNKANDIRKRLSIAKSEL